MPSSYINKLSLQGLNEIRSFSPPYSRLKGMAFTEREKPEMKLIPIKTIY